MATLLIVEDACDGPAVVDVLQQANAKWELLTTSDPEHAVSLASESGVDLVILDLAAPCLDTLSLLERFQERHPSLPIVVLASPGNEQLVVQALCGGATTYVPHAALSDDLSSSVAGVLDASERSRRQIRLQESMIESISVFSLASDLEWVPAMLQFIQENLARMGICDEADCMRVGVALEEA